MKIIKTSLWFVLFFSVSLLALMPARWALQWLPEEQPLRFYQVSGTLWNFKVGELQSNGLSYRNLQARFDPLCLLQLSLCERIEAEEGEINLRFALVDQSLWLENSEWYDRIGPIVSTLQPQFAGVEGFISITVDSLQWQNQQITGLQGQLALQDLSVPSLGLVPGQILADVRLQSGLIEAFIQDRSEALDVSGTATIGTDGRYEVSVNFSQLQAQQLGTLADLLRSSGKVQKDGSYRLQQRGGLPIKLPLASAEDA